MVSEYETSSDCPVSCDLLSRKAFAKASKGRNPEEREVGEDGHIQKEGILTEASIQAAVEILAKFN